MAGLGLAALQAARLKKLHGEHDSAAYDESHAATTADEAEPGPELLHGLLGRLDQRPAAQPRQHATQPLPTSARGQSLLQQLYPSRTALCMHHKLQLRPGTHDASPLETASPVTSSFDFSLPWERHAQATPSAFFHIARLDRFLGPEGGGNKETDDDEDGGDELLQRAGGADGSGSDNDESMPGGRLTTKDVAGAILGNGLNQEFVLHRILWACRAPPGGWRGIRDAVSPAEPLPAMFRELGDQGMEQGQGQQGWQMMCARSLCALITEAAESMGAGGQQARRKALAKGLDRAEEFAKGIGRVQLRWPAVDPCEYHRQDGGADGASSAPGGTRDRTAYAQERGQPWDQRSLDQLWVDVQAARGDGGRLAGLLGEERVNGLLGRDLAAGFGAGGGAARGQGQPSVQLGPWLGLGMKAAEGRPEATEVLRSALLGLLLIHRTFKSPYDLLDAPIGSSHPCHLAAFHIAYDALCGVAQQSPAYDHLRPIPPVLVMYGMVVLVPPGALEAVLRPREPYAPLAGPSAATDLQLLSPTHLEALVTVLLERPMEALAALAACTAWRGGELMERANTRGAACNAASTIGLRPGAGAAPGGSCAVSRQWADGPPGPVTRTWRRALALARATEVLRAKRLELQLVRGPDMLLVGEAYRTEQVVVQAMREMEQLGQAWAGGVLGSETARDAVLQRVRGVVRQLDELGLLQDPAVRRTGVVPYGQVGATCVSVAARVERLQGQLGRQVEAAGAESDVRARLGVLDVSLRICKTRMDAVEQTRDLLEGAAKVERVAELGARVQSCRRALLRWRRQGYTPQNAEELCEWVSRLVPGLADTHPGTWGAAVQRLQEALKGPEEGRERQAARGDKPEVLGAVLADGLLGVLTGMALNLPVRYMKLAPCAVAGCVYGQLYDVLDAALDRHANAPGLSQQLRVIPMVLLITLRYVPPELCKSLVRQLEPAVRQAARGSSSSSSSGNGCGGRDPQGGQQPAANPLGAVYDNAARLVLYDMWVAKGAVLLSRALEGGAGGDDGSDSDDWDVSAAGGGDTLKWGLIEKMELHVAHLVAGAPFPGPSAPDGVQESPSDTAQGRSRVDAEAHRGSTAVERNGGQGHGGAKASGSDAGLSGSRGRGVAAPYGGGAVPGDGAEPRAAEAPRPSTATDELLQLLDRKSSRVVQACGDVGGGGGGLHVVLDSAWVDVSRGEDDELISALLLARLLPMGRKGLARMLVRGPEAMKLLGLALTGERLVVQPVWAEQARDIEDPLLAAAAPGDLDPEAAMVSAAAGVAVRLQVTSGAMVREEDAAAKGYNWRAMAQAKVAISDDSRWSSALSQLRQAFFPADKRLGGTFVAAEGALGTLRAALLVAKVRAELNAEGRDLAMWVHRVATVETRQHRRRQKQGAGASAREDLGGDMDIDAANRTLNTFEHCLQTCLHSTELRVEPGLSGHVLKPATIEDSLGWHVAGKSAQKLLRGLRAEGSALRVDVVVTLQVMEVEVGRPGRLAPPPGREAAGGKQGKAKGAKGARK